MPLIYTARYNSLGRNIHTSFFLYFLGIYYDKKAFKTITLDSPIKRGDTEITEITLRRPLGGDLGLDLN